MPSDNPNIFIELGFESDEAELLQARSIAFISQRLAIRTKLCIAVEQWIRDASLTQKEAARILGISCIELDRLTAEPPSNLSIDKLVTILIRAGKRIEIAIA